LSFNNEKKTQNKKEDEQTTNEGEERILSKVAKQKQKRRQHTK